MNELTLAITTIGDLLLNNKITRENSGKSIDNVRLTIPNYQRPYKWTARNVIQLLDDLVEACNAEKEVYRVGTLILHNENDTYNIVDGQQRIITFSLLLYALYELENLENRKPINFLEQKLPNNDYNRHNISKNLSTFRRRICKKLEGYVNDEHVANMKRLRDFIENQCELIVVITDDLSSAFQFFDSQNARGKSLYPHDLLKAYHLREMNDVEPNKVEQIVQEWESISQNKLSVFFGDYLFRIKEWINGEWAGKLNEHTLYKFKGVNKYARTPYAQFYKGAYSYAEWVNSSSMPFVSGTPKINAFQLNTPIIAGKPFFDYTKHYYNLLSDIQNNNSDEGFYIKGNAIVKTLDTYYSKGVGNKIARLLFDTSLLLYIDRFCPATYPSKTEIELFEQFVVNAFIWAYSLRAQYKNLGWQSAQNYILRIPINHQKINSFNIYKLIIDSDTPVSLLSALAEKLNPLTSSIVNDNRGKSIEIDKETNGIFENYLHFFRINNFY